MLLQPLAFLILESYLSAHYPIPSTISFAITTHGYYLHHTLARLDKSETPNWLHSEKRTDIMGIPKAWTKWTHRSQSKAS